MAKKEGLKQLFDRIRNARQYNSLHEKILAHPDCNAHSIVRFLVSSSRCFERDVKKWAKEWFSPWWLPACALSAALASDEHLRTELSVEDTLKAAATMMGESDESFYLRLEELLSGLSLRKQFALFDRLIKLSGKWRRKRLAYQYALIYLVENFNVPPRKKGARSVIKMSVPILGRPCIFEKDKLKRAEDRGADRFPPGHWPFGQVILYRNLLDMRYGRVSSFCFENRPASALGPWPLRYLHNIKI